MKEKDFNNPFWGYKNTAWDNLPMERKAVLIKTAVKHGLIDLADIKNRYNEFASGGRVYDGVSEVTQQMKIGQPYYDYNRSDKPLTQNVLFPEIVVFGRNRKRDYTAAAEKERQRQWGMAKTYFGSSPSASNIVKGIGALAHSTSLFTNASTVNPFLITGEAPSVAPAGTPLNSTTSNLLKWLGKPLNQKPTKSALTFLKDEFNPEYSRMAKMLQDNGVDLSRIDASDMALIFKKRLQELMNNDLERFTIVKPIGETGYSLADFAKGIERPVGEAQFSQDANDIFHMEDIMNYTRNSTNPYRGVQERGLNAAINTAKSVNSPGVVTGEIYLSAPKQYHVTQKFRDREVFDRTGQHSNFNMVRDYTRRTGAYDDGTETSATSMLNLARAGETERKSLIGAPTWLLKSPTGHVPTKSVLFNPRNINDEGKMIIDWDNPFVFKSGGRLRKYKL